MTLLARFNTVALQVAPSRPSAWHGTPPPAVWQALTRWCAMAQPGELDVARLVGGAPGEAAAVAEAISRELDGDTRLRALPRWSGLLWRLQVKLLDALPWRTRRSTDPWDCGYLRAPSAPSPLAQLHLRRPTLVVLEADADAPDLKAWHDRPPHARWPLLLLVLAPTTAPGPLRWVSAALECEKLSIELKVLS